MQVVRIRKTHKGKIYCTTLIRHSYREDGKVKNRTIANISELPEHTISAIELSLKGKALVPFEDSYHISQSKPHGHVYAILHMIRKLGLEKMIHPKPSRNRSLILAMIIMRILNPRSKLSTARALDQKTCTTSLNQLLQLGDVTEDDLYTALDWLVKQKKSIEMRLSNKHLRNGSLILYDLTSTYYEGHRCRYAKRGYSRDRKRGFPQIVFGMLCTQDGIPVSVQIYDGNTSDSTTLADQLDKVREEFELSEVVWVGDRGTITQTQITEELSQRDGLKWITALRSDSIRVLMEQGDIQMSLFDTQHMFEIESADYPGERLVVCRNPMLAEDRHRKRESLLAATENELQEIKKATERSQRRLSGATRIAEKVAVVMNKYGMKKHFQVTYRDDGFDAHRDESSIAREKQLDGIYVIRSNVSRRRMSESKLVSTYKSLSNVEQGFRTLKQIGLKVRPIYHYRDNRVESHIFLCMLSYYVQHHLENAWSRLLYRDDWYDKYLRRERGERKVSVKKRQKKDSAGNPLHTFPGLLSYLGLVMQNTVSFCATGQDVLLYTESDDLQRLAMDLINQS